MRKELFDILVALEKDRAQLNAEALAAQIGLDQEKISKGLEELEGLGYVCDGKITDLGVQALEPYKSKRAIFIAAGFGSRLRPVTLETAKPLVKVNGTRIIDTLIDGVMAAGVEEIYVVCGYLGHQFQQLKEKYPNINLVTNEMYTQANNISSVWLTREHLRNAYVLEADLLIHNKEIFDKYLYHSSYLGIPTEGTDDWFFRTDDDGVIYEVGHEEGVINRDCYQMLGISYWSQEDGARLPAHLEETFSIPECRNEDWCYVPMFKYKDIYKVHVRPCSKDDIQEIDTFEELCAVDSSYNSYR